MYLKGVEIFGFKSFGERIKIDFNGGITSIVGPNGSGKSNILDGILWVLGEQSYKNIRAKESKDIIFSGGEGKKPANFAEVSLFIDNKDNFFPIEAENIKITRKMSKDGENDYLINDRKVRLKDIGELFLDTGVGKSAYSVIGQGKVERIISSSNKEIKGIIEEAAGVKKFQYKKVEAEKRLDKVENELEKIELILKEIGENRSRVEKQSKKAIEFLEIKEKRNRKSKEVLTYEFEIKKSEFEKVGIENTEIEREVKKIEEKLKIFETENSEIESKQNLLKEKIESYSENSGNLKQEIEVLEKEEIRLKERGDSYKREIEEKEGRERSASQEIEEKKSLISKLKVEKSEIDNKVKEIEGKNREFEEGIEEKEKNKKDSEISIELKKKKIMDLEVEKLKLVNEIENSSRRIKSSEFKISNLKNELIEFNDRFKKNEEEFNKEKTLRDEKRRRLEETVKRQKELEERISNLSKDMNKASEIIRNAEFEEKRNTAKLQALYRVQESNEGFYKGVKEVLNARIPGVFGAVISLINVPEQYQKAIEAAIPGNLQDIVVETSEVAKKGIAILKEKKAGRASFLALDTIKIGTLKDTPKMDGVIGRASELIQADRKYEAILKMLLGNVLVVENVDIALEILKKDRFSGNIVTLGGELMSSRGRITGGENTNSIVSQIFERKKEIQHLEEFLKEQRSKLTVWHEKMQNMNSELEKIEDEIGGIDSLEDSLRKSVRECEEKCRALEEKKNKIEKDKRIVEIELKEEENYISEYGKRVESSQSEKGIAEKMILEIKNEIETETQKITILSDELQKIKNDYSDIRILYLNNKDRSIQLEKDRIKEEKTLFEMNENQKRDIEILNNMKKELEKMKEKAHTILEEISRKTFKFENENKELKNMKEEKQKLELREKELNKELRELESELFKRKEISHRKKEFKEKIEKELSEIKFELEELIEVKVEKREFSDEEIKKMKEELKELERKLKSFDSVNLNSIEEFKELDGKYNFINQQKEDLEQGRKSLYELIKEIDETIEKRFYEAYNEINKNFNEMCVETLDNSEGKLTLHNEEDFLNCGVEISVKYKNKKRQALSLLSGGEKSMVAIAFIMAIFMYKPSPFTFLDEIEAALDEKNTRKLISKLKEFTDRSQFILITHNKETMKASDSLYGVTMNKKIGISKLVPVKI